MRRFAGHDPCPQVGGLLRWRLGTDGAQSLAKRHVLELADIDGAAEFFDTAVDGTFSWGQNGEIIAAYRLYIPMYGRPGASVFTSLDDQAWADENRPLLGFLGLVQGRTRKV